MGAGWKRVNELSDAVLYSLVLSVCVLIIISVIVCLRRRKARNGQVSKQMSYYTNVSNRDSKPLLADSDEETPSPSRRPIPAIPSKKQVNKQKSYSKMSYQSLLADSDVSDVETPGPSRPLPTIPSKKHVYEPIPKGDSWTLGPES